MDKRLKEINDRKLEIRSMLQGEDKVDLNALEKELADLEAEEKELRRRAEVAGAISISDSKVPEVRSIEKPGAEKAKQSDPYDTVEYRKAFMTYVRTGVMGAELRDADANTTTSDIGAVIPTSTLNKIVDELSAYGDILKRVTKTNYLTGVTVPVSSSKPTASWVSEGATSYLREKPVGSVVFGHFKLRIAVSASLEAEYMSLSAFEAALVSNIAEAMAKALEAAIVSGNGSGKPTGILHVGDTAVGTTQEVHTLSYGVLTAAEGALPVAYENGAVWVMAKQTFMSFVGLTDTTGQPIAHVNYGIDGATKRYLLGREVVLTDNLSSFSAASVNDIFAFIYRMQDYMLNTNFSIGIKTYEDNETDDIIRKSVLVCDGKPVDTHSLIKLKKIAVPQAEAAASDDTGTP